MLIYLGPPIPPKNLTVGAIMINFTNVKTEN